MNKKQISKYKLGRYGESNRQLNNWNMIVSEYLLQIASIFRAPLECARRHLSTGARNQHQNVYMRCASTNVLRAQIECAQKNFLAEIDFARINS